jgi:hypothetical protein
MNTCPLEMQLCMYAAALPLDLDTNAAALPMKIPEEEKHLFSTCPEALEMWCWLHGMHVIDMMSSDDLSKEVVKGGNWFTEKWYSASQSPSYHDSRTCPM